MLKKLHTKKVGTIQRRLIKFPALEELGNLCGANLTGVSLSKSMKQTLTLNTAIILGAGHTSFTRKGIGIS